jgi:D-hydroxyproline dehydrogenase subunit beta
MGCTLAIGNRARSLRWRAVSAPDVLVIGGGIVGCAAALFAAEAGAAVVLLEAEAVASAASGRNAGSIQHPFDDVRAALYEESVAIHRRFGVIGAEAAGLLAVGDGPQVARAAVAAAAPFAGLAVEAVEGAALQALEPELAGGLSGALIAGTGFPAHPAAATRRLAEAARALGVRVEEGVRAAPVIDATGGRCVGVQTAGGAQRAAGAVLVAAGPWSSDLLDATGAWRPVGPLWGVTVQVELSGGRRVRHRIEEWTEAGELDAGGHFEATPLGDVTVLGASRATAAPDEAATAAAIRARAARFLPAVADAAVVVTRTCARPITADGLPLIGPVPGIDGLHVAAGHGPYGISLGPASGRIAADAVLGRAPAPAAFAPGR